MTEPNLSKFLPPSLGTLFGQPIDGTDSQARPAAEAQTIPGAFAAPELCTLVDDYRADVMPSDPVVEVKLDGLRCLYIGGDLVTREGSTFEAAAHCLPILRGMEANYGRRMMFDGEYIEDGGLEATLSAFRSRKGNGCLWLFDAVPLDEWRSGSPSRQTLIDRKTALRRQLLAVTEGRTNVAVGFVEHKAIGRRDVDAHAQAVWEAGFEGLVIKSEASRYVRKRTGDWMKVKQNMRSPVVVLDVLGKNAKGIDVAKALLVRLAINPRAEAFKIPVAGPLARYLWEDRSNFVGSTQLIDHHGFTGGGVPREARLAVVPAAAFEAKD